MKYQSTRGENESFSFEQVLLSGFAPDGGLFVPHEIPKLDPEILLKWKVSKLSYTKIVQNVVRLYVPEHELSESQLSDAINKSFKDFTCPEIIPIKNLERENTIHIAEMFHGSTASFKDLALSLSGQFLEHFTKKRNSRLVVLVGTSGDTGSAAMASVRELSKVSIIVLYPKGMVSEVQELQLRVAAMTDNAQLFAVEGSSDDLDKPIAQCFPNSNLTSVNSINWARIMIQICHYVYLYINDNGDGPIKVVVPTGAAGNVTAGVYAKLMGVPLELYVACNENCAVHDLISSGILEMGRTCIQTPANAMDICNPYNVERLLFLASNSKVDDVTKLMTTVGRNILPQKTVENLKTMIKDSGSYTNDVIYKTMHNIWNSFQYVVCPHTATAVRLALDKFNTECYILATASPLKFPEAVAEAKISSSDWNANELLDSLRLLPLKLPKQMKEGDDWLKILKNEIAFILAQE